MQIQKINLQPKYIANQNLNQNKKTPTQLTSQYNYNPIYYKDFNISFGERLFRTPENFYEQDFNKENMPESMKKYLSEDYESRKHIPPIQVFQEVFSDLDYADDLEDVKILYPEEPLFANLKNKTGKKHRSGSLAEIQLMQEEFGPLFKDGSDDLGLYILKKIYQEGKTLKEINKDLKNDISDNYKGMTEITYDTIKQFGIKYPKLPFWKSFIVTREDFPYVYIPKNGGERTNTTHSSGTNKSENSTEKVERPNKFRDVKQHDIDKISDSLLEGHGNLKRTKKNLKRNRLKEDGKELPFVCKYLSQIMSLALENCNASEEMTMYFRNLDDEEQELNQKQKLQKYWRENPEMKKRLSTAISDSIKLFFFAYGADGNNEYFQDLVKYAESIKPRREAEKREYEIKHNEMQKYYDDFFAELDKQEEVTVPSKMNEEIQELDEIAKQLDILLKEYNAQMHNFEINGHEYSLVFDPKDVYSILMERRFGDIAPKSWIQKYIRFTQNNTDPRYVLSIIKQLTDIEIPIPEEDLYTKDEIVEKIVRTDNEFNMKNRIDNNAMMAAVIQEYFDKTHDTEKIHDMYYEINAMSLLEEIKKVSDDKFEAPMDSNSIEEKYREYKKPLTNSEASRICTQIISTLKTYRPENVDDYKLLIALTSVAIMCKAKDKNTEEFRSSLYSYIKEQYGGAARIILDKNISQEMKIEQAIYMLSLYTTEKPNLIRKFLKNNIESCMYLRSNGVNI